MKSLYKKLIRSLMPIGLFVVFICSTVCAKDVKDVKPPIDFPINVFLLLSVLLFVISVLLFLLIRFLLKYYKKKKEEKALLKKVAWEIAFEQLHALQEQDLPAQGKIKEYFSALSDILRHYIENHFEIRAPEMTTEEFLSKIKENSSMDGFKDHVHQFLVNADMVKFAKGIASLQEMEENFMLVNNFVETTKEKDHKIMETALRSSNTKGKV